MSEPGRSELLDPESKFGFQPGAERRLIRWSDLLDYFQHIASHSDRVQYQQLGTVSGDLPLALLTISAPENLVQLERFQEIQRRLTDPRALDVAVAEKLLAEGRAIMLVTCSIHATEVGSTQMSPQLVYELACSTDESLTQMLHEVILLLVPCLNPWGLELIADWYERTLDTPAEGLHPPELYHPYAGHDNNRDWFMHTQIETQLIVDHIHNRWHPHIVLDQHQMMTDGPRYVVPPYVDPYDPNVDPILQAGIAQIGAAMTAMMVAEGKPGVANQVIFDAYSPSRAYAHYHGGMRVLTEAASCNLASTIQLEQGELREVRGFDPTRRASNNPLPWTGGDWRLDDIVTYNLSAVYACLESAARFRQQWIRNFLRVQQMSVNAAEPFAFVVPPDQDDPGAVDDLLDVMHRGLVEIECATERFDAGGVTYPAGTFVIRTGQPFGRYAKTLLEVQDYPGNLTGGGRRNSPYDITSHSLPLYLGVEVVEVSDPFDAVLEPLSNGRDWEQSGAVAGIRTGTYALSGRQNRAVRVVNRLLEADTEVHRIAEDAIAGEETFPPGTFIVRSLDAELIEETARESGITALGLPDEPAVPMCRVRAPRIGLYRSWVHNAIDEGWTRFILEQYGFKFKTLRDREIRQGSLRRQFDAIILPHQSSEDIMLGNSAAEYPHEFAGGIGERGAANLRRFAEAGGTLVALDGACEVAMRHLYLPVINPIETLSEQQFYAPGATLQMLVDPRHPIAYGYEREVAGLVTGRHAFSPIAEDEVRQVARYPANNQLLSGWLHGAEHIRGMASLVDVPVQEGRAILFGFRPQFRAQTRGTYRMLFNALYYSVLESAD